MSTGANENDKTGERKEYYSPSFPKDNGHEKESIYNTHWPVLYLHS